jgi:hypothetical protein
VTIEEGELLTFAAEIGSLSLVLRGYQDLEITNGIPDKGMEDIFSPKKSPDRIERISIKH